MDKWQEANKWEQDWWGACNNTFREEERQIKVYAPRMGIQRTSDNKTPYIFDLEGKSVLDIGGGPTSMLLKAVNSGKRVVVDPCDFPEWVAQRYKTAGIEYYKLKGEDVIDDGRTPTSIDEVWIYNVLQHTDNPSKIVDSAKLLAKIIRIFEWIDTPPTDGHPHTLTEKGLNEWLGGEGKVEVIPRTEPAWGKCYYGIFVGN